MKKYLNQQIKKKTLDNTITPPKYNHLRSIGTWQCWIKYSHQFSTESIKYTLLPCFTNSKHDFNDRVSGSPPWYEFGGTGPSKSPARFPGYRSLALVDSSRRYLNMISMIECLVVLCDVNLEVQVPQHLQHAPLDTVHLLWWTVVVVTWSAVGMKSVGT